MASPGIKGKGERGKYETTSFLHEEVLLGGLCHRNATIAHIYWVVVDYYCYYHVLVVVVECRKRSETLK